MGRRMQGPDDDTDDEPRDEEAGRALGRIASGVFVVTASFESHREGMIGSWIMQAAMDPPALTVAIKKNRSIRLLIESSQALVVNVLGKDDGDLMKSFFKPPGPGQDAFAGLAVEPCERAAGAPILRDATAWIAGAVLDGMDAGDHIVYLVEVVGGRVLKKADPKTHVRETGFKY